MLFSGVIFIRSFADSPAKDAATLPDAKAFRVLTTLRFGNGRRTSSEAVIALGSAKEKDDKDDKEPYRILSWQDQAETAARPFRQVGG